MPFNTKRTAAIYAREILRVVSGAELAENSVVDGLYVPLNADNRRILESGTVMVYAGVDEVQQLAIDATGGTYTLTYSAQTTSALAYNATAAQIQAALEALSNIGVGDVYVEQPDPAKLTYKIRFASALGATDVAAITSTPSLTGGASTATITTLKAGAAAPGATQKVKPAPTSGVTQAQVAGIVMHTTEFYPDVDAFGRNDAAVALFTKNCHFDASQLGGGTGNYASNATAVKAAMSGAGNGRTANCTFE